MFLDDLPASYNISLYTRDLYFFLPVSRRTAAFLFSRYYVTDDTSAISAFYFIRRFSIISVNSATTLVTRLLLKRAVLYCTCVYIVPTVPFVSRFFFFFLPFFLGSANSGNRRIAFCCMYLPVLETVHKLSDTITGHARNISNFCKEISAVFPLATFSK